MRRNLAAAGVFASFALIVSYFGLYLAGDEQAWWIALLVGTALFLIVFSVLFFTGLQRAARYDAYEKALTQPYRARFALTLREKGGLHTDARLYISEDGWLFVDLKRNREYERLIKPEEVEKFDLSGEDVEIYLKSGELFSLESDDKEKLAAYVGKETDGQEDDAPTV